VEPVLKPKNMTMEQLEHELGKASQKFYMHKFHNLHQLTPWKQEFMLSVLDIFINHSYLAGQMKAAMKEGKEMPEEVKKLLKTVKDHSKGARIDHHPAVAPIP
jgi:anaerobic magnesium-protoporphyrin IX monomethyl ester cyclase